MPALQIACPSCGCRRTHVVSTSQDDSGQIVRRRHCRVCEHRWYTLQQPEVEISAYQLVWAKSKARARV